MKKYLVLSLEIVFCNLRKAPSPPTAPKSGPKKLCSCQAPSQFLAKLSIGG